MSWGAPLGFSSGPSPFEMANTAGFGEPGWYCRFRPIPTVEFPFKARFRTPVASAVFDSPEDARAFTEHPGDIKELARRYLAWVFEGVDPTQERV